MLGLLKVRLPTIRCLVRYALMAAALGLGGWYGLPFCIPLPPGLLGDPDASPVLVDRHGTPISHLTLPDASRSMPVSLADFPADLIACTLAAEDKRCYGHGGVDFLATGRAAGDVYIAIAMHGCTAFARPVIVTRPGPDGTRMA